MHLKGNGRWVPPEVLKTKQSLGAPVLSVLSALVIALFETICILFQSRVCLVKLPKVQCLNSSPFMYNRIVTQVSRTY